MGSFAQISTTINFLPFYSNNHFAEAHYLYCSRSRSVSTFKSIKASGLTSYLRLENEENKKGDKMTIGSTVRIYDKKLVIDGRTILSNVPDDVILSSNTVSGSVDGAFVGADFENSDYRHVIPIGTLRDTRFMASFRFKLWWMSQKMGTKGSEIPLETQFLLLESKQNKDDNIIYIVFLPLIEGSFRASLQGNSNNQIELCLESGDNNTRSSSFTHAMYIGYSTSDPFSAISNAIHKVKQHLNTFKQRHEKKLPSIVDYFGWCTWDAFYQEVSQEGVEAGLSTLTSSDTPCKFIIIDDGWQSVAPDNLDSAKSSLNRLTDIKENKKFQNKEDPSSGISSIVKIAKEKYGLHNVYVWHAITGYWGGVKPGEYGSIMQFPKVSEGVMQNEPWMKTDVLTLNGVGLVSSKNVYRFYNELHEYLSKAGVDGVKVDVQCVLETLGHGNGGRVALTQHFHEALDASVAKHFPDNGCIACMSHNTDALYCSKQTAIVRASDDFYPRDHVSHTIHIASVAYNSVFLGEFMLPDWDMFHSLHPVAEYHASARAISGGPIYVSDAPGKHNFELLKKLVLPDGSILRARLPARPTLGCLFTDPTRDNISLLKIWNMNKYTGVLGIYNCQGAAWSSTEKKNAFHAIETETLSCAVKGSDVHLISEAANDRNWNGDCVLYKHGEGELVILPHGTAVAVSLKVLEHVIFTVSPIKVLAPGCKFAPLGLGDMYNGGGAIEGLSYQTQTADNVALICMEVKGCGNFVAYSSAKPKKCSINSSDIEFSYDPTCGLLSFKIQKMPQSEQILHQIFVLV